jgi:hypothetical protein
VASDFNARTFAAAGVEKKRIVKIPHRVAVKSTHSTVHEVLEWAGPICNRATFKIPTYHNNPTRSRQRAARNKCKHTACCVMRQRNHATHNDAAMLNDSQAAALTCGAALSFALSR